MAHMLPFLLPIPAHMGELEPSIFVVPVPFVIELTLDFEALSIEVEYFQEDFDGEFGNRHVTSRRQIMITGTVMSFGGKFRDKNMLSYSTYRCGRNASATIVSRIDLDTKVNRSTDGLGGMGISSVHPHNHVGLLPTAGTLPAREKGQLVDNRDDTPSWACILS